MIPGDPMPGGYGRACSATEVEVEDGGRGLRSIFAFELDLAGEDVPLLPFFFVEEEDAFWLRFVALPDRLPLLDLCAAAFFVDTGVAGGETSD